MLVADAYGKGRRKRHCFSWASWAGHWAKLPGACLVSWSREKGKFLNIIALGIYLNIMCSILNGIWAKIWIQIEINKELNILDHGHIGNCTIIEIDNIV
jgi:hypothetical protein